MHRKRAATQRHSYERESEKHQTGKKDTEVKSSNDNDKISFPYHHIPAEKAGERQAVHSEAETKRESEIPQRIRGRGRREM